MPARISIRRRALSGRRWRCWLRDDALCAGRQRPAGCRGAHSAWQTAAVYGAGVLTGVVLTVLAVVALAFGGRNEADRTTSRVRELGRPPRRGLERAHVLELEVDAPHVVAEVVFADEDRLRIAGVAGDVVGHVLLVQPAPDARATVSPA